MWATFSLAVLAACGGPNADERLARANRYADEGRFREAVVEYRSAINLDPQRGDIRVRLGDTYIRMVDPARAVEEYVRAADLLPGDPAVQLKAGKVLLVVGRFEEAKARAEKALEADPKHVDAQILLGNAFAGLRDAESAIAEYQEAIALDPASEQAYTGAGFSQMARGDNAQAEAAFKKAVEVAPKAIPARLALANFLWATERLTDAEREFKATVAVDPSSFIAQRALGAFYNATNRVALAEPQFKAIALAAKTPDALIGLADFYVGARRFDDAIKVLNDLARNDQSYAAATTRLAAIDAVRGQRAAGLARLREVLARDSKDLGANLLSARILLLEGKRDEALAHAQAIVDQDLNVPATAGAYIVIGSVQGSLDRFDDAIKSFEQAAQRPPYPVEADLALASLHLRTGASEKGLARIQRVLSVQRNNRVARSLLVQLYRAHGRADLARRELATLQKDLPNSPAVLNLAGAQHLADGEVEQARSAYTKAVAIDPANTEAIAGLVSIDVRRGQPKAGLARLEAAMKVVSPSPDFLVLAARTYAATGDVRQAESLLIKAMEADPARLQPYALLGQLYVSQNRLANARGVFEQILARAPNSVPAHTMLGVLAEARKDLAAAEQHYRSALQLEPRAVMAANNLAWVYAASNRNLEEAHRLATLAQSLVPGEAPVNDTLGWINVRMGRFEAAIRHLEMSVRQDPNVPLVHYHLGVAYLDAGDIHEGRAALQRALAAGEFDGAADARARLSQLPQR